MVDLKKLKIGDIVKFRCGGEAAVEHIMIDTKDIILHFKGYEAENVYTYCTLNNNGKWKGESWQWQDESLLDIVEIVPYVETILTWYEINNKMESIQKKGKNYPKDAKFRFINGSFTRISENSKKLEQLGNI